jgi:Uma2 family endonuclease
MPTPFLEPIVCPPLASIPHKKWTRAEIEELCSRGWFADEHYELIDEELINKRGKTEAHVFATMFMQEWFISIFEFMRVLKGDPINVDEYNEPEPDLVALRESLERLRKIPGPEDTLLVVEVADSTLAMDLSTKADLYARAGIPDYWVLDVNQRRMIVHRSPSSGKYRSVIVYREDESVAPLAAPESAFRVAAAFGQ